MMLPQEYINSVQYLALQYKKCTIVEILHQLSQRNRFVYCATNLQVRDAIIEKVNIACRQLYPMCLMRNSVSKQTESIN